MGTWARRRRRAGWSDDAGRRAWQARREPSPAVQALIRSQGFFDVGPDSFFIENVHAAPAGRQADLLILSGTDYNDGDVRPQTLCIQVRDLEAMIQRGHVMIAFYGDARDYNAAPRRRGRA